MKRDGRIARKFRELRARAEAGLIPFVVAGDPDLARTKQIVRELEAQGADLIELGMPFSDPMADGPANQRAMARGLAAGASLSAILAMVSEIRKESQIPLILFGYFNPLLHYGCQRFCADAAQAGVDGLLIVDLPVEESAELARPATANHLDLVYLLAPTTPIERSRKIARAASGFLYYVSVVGVTGARSSLASDLGQRMQELRSVTHLPIAVGFGISTPEQAREVASIADAVVVGSALSLLIEEHRGAPDLLETVGAFVSALKGAIRQAPHAMAASGSS
ncbi:MAG TPA: tryptophan synthase subunit alpha [Candidatus Binataceae bacterium]|nr:tryptophan synthase subunit alpha [Candidatus Binataceae bacterium]